MEVAMCSRMAFLCGIALAFTVPSALAGTYSGGSGTPEDPYRISTVADWVKLTTCVSDWHQHFVLINDMDFEGVGVVPVGGSDPFWTDFSGTLDGQGHEICNLRIVQPNRSNVGLFGSTDKIKVNDLRLTNIYIEGRHNVGGLIGTSKYGGDISSCQVAGLVTGSQGVGGLVGDNWYGRLTGCSVKGEVIGKGGSCGGLAGGNRGGTISGCWVEGTVRGRSESIGGLVGYNDMNRGPSSWARIEDCHAEVDVLADGVRRVGGLIGLSSSFAHYACAQGQPLAGPIVRCSASGTVTGYSEVGGLIGSNHSPVLFCCARSHVDGVVKVGGLIGWNHRSQQGYSGDICAGYCGYVRASYAGGVVIGGREVGGLVGYGEVEGFWQYSVSSSYATSLVTGYKDVGGLVGKLSERARVVSSFWDIDASGQNSSAGGTGKPTADMQRQRTFSDAGWDFREDDGEQADWMMLHEGEDYPRLAWEEVFASDLAGLYGVDAVDFAELALYWGRSGCPPGCGRADIDGDGTVAAGDLIILAEQWLLGR